jgi:DmsE family decaheme c-type cytochrome
MSKRNRVSVLAGLALFCATALGAATPARAAALNGHESGAAQAIATSESAAENAPAPLYSTRGATTCLKCHDSDIVEGDRVYKSAMPIFSTPHGMKGDLRTPMGQHQCETCHGPSQAHVESAPPKGQKKTPVPIDFTGPNAAPAPVRNQVCLSCHENGLRMNWKGSLHQKNNIACVSCHTIHVQKDPVLVRETQPFKCFTCHAQQRAESFEYSHHPIREGKVVCSDCHNPHGSPGPHLMKEFTVNQVCYTCHADKRGPMLFEHQPVRENCLNCHAPHGSNEARLLKERMNFLCSSCHSSTAHYSGGAFGGRGNLPGSLQATFNSALANNRMCLNCHSQVHGSNSPNGAYFFR